MIKAPEAAEGEALVPADTARQSSVLIALIIGQICLHSCMTGLRLAAPLQVLRQGHSEWAVGLLLGLFAVAPMVIALPAGRMTDRLGYHVPMRLAVLLTVLGGALAVGSTWLSAGQWPLLCLSAIFTGAGTNYGLIAIQRTAGRHASGSTQLKRVFSWLGLAPALANVIGPVLAGVMVDWVGFRWAYAALAVLPLLGLWSALAVPAEVRSPPATAAPNQSSWDLLRVPGVARLFLVNWLLSASWDVHAFVVPILGHERGFSASSIGAILGAFAGAVTLVRLIIPSVAHRLPESRVLVIAMLSTGAILGVYPLVSTALLMGVCAVLLGLALGSVQPMILTKLHHLTPAHRHGEAIALRSMTIGLASAAMPLLFGMAGAAVGAASLFWAMGAAVALGSRQVHRVDRAAAGQVPLRT
jgi:MFS family permease